MATAGILTRSQSDPNLLTNVSVALEAHLAKNAPNYHVLSDIKAHVKVGDILEFHRGFYSHYALYLGDGMVMNIYADDYTSTSAKISRLTLEEVCLDSKVRVDNQVEIASSFFQTPKKSLPEIIRAAEELEDQIVPYELFDRNCEYYCTLWRYGIGFSTQVARPTSTPLINLIDSTVTSSDYDLVKALFGVGKTAFNISVLDHYKKRALSQPPPKKL